MLWVSRLFERGVVEALLFEFVVESEELVDRAGVDFEAASDVVEVSRLAVVVPDDTVDCPVC